MVGLIILAIIVVFLAVILVRGLRFKPLPEQEAKATVAPVDPEMIGKKLQTLVQIPTVSYYDKSREDAAAFGQLQDTLQTLFPHVAEKCTRDITAGKGVLYRWAGKSAEKPWVLMAHYDVVPVEADRWQHPPFEGYMADGVLWGRGTLDTKGTLTAAMESADELIAEGFVPEQDIYLAFSGDEEVNGPTCGAILAELQKRGVTPAFVLDEGGAIVDGVFPGVKESCAVIGTAEKGMMELRLTCETKGGHASTPPVHTAVGILAQAVAKLEKHPCPFKLTAPAEQMLDTLGRRSTLLYRVIFGNLWCFAPVLDLMTRKSGGELNALVRTTCAFTQASGSKATNVLPASATMSANMRLIPGMSRADAVAWAKKIIDDDRITVTDEQGMEPSPISRIDDGAFERLTTSIRATWPGTVATPYLMLACSDSRHYARHYDHVYRFSAMPMSKEERGLIHGDNERIQIKHMAEAVQFYKQLIHG